MDCPSNTKALLELLNRPAFCVRDGIIVEANECALQRFIKNGDRIEDYLLQGAEAYQSFTDGCLFMTVGILDLPYGATVTKLQDCDLFLLEKLADGTRQTLALAAQQLRQPLNMLFTISEGLKADLQAQMKHSLNRMHRQICNMADLVRYDTKAALFMQPTVLTEVFAEIMKKAAAALRVTKIKLHYTPLPEIVVGMADRNMLERAVLNMVSNAAKYSNQGDTLYAKLTRSGNILKFTLQDNGEGFPPDVLDTAFFRYLREPCIEDGRHGIGLGLALVSSVAFCHGGTVLINQPKTGGAQVTMTLTILPCDDATLRSPIQVPTSDYASGHDRSLLELSDVLPSRSYKPKKASDPNEDPDSPV